MFLSASRRLRNRLVRNQGLRFRKLLKLRVILPGRECRIGSEGFANGGTAELDRLIGRFIELLLPVLHKASTRKQEIVLNIRGFEQSEALGGIQGFRKFIVLFVVLDDESQHVGIVREIA